MALATTDSDPVQNGGPLVYRCASPVVFAKRSEDPSSTRIVKLNKAVGSVVYASGLVWTGPNGGKWAELDAGKGELGWMLVSGPGFGLQGPALIDADKDDLLTVQVHLLGSSDMGGQPGGIVWESLVSQEGTIGDIKKSMCKETGLVFGMCCLAKEMPCKAPNNGVRLPADYMPELPDNKEISKCKFGSHATIYLVYVGDLPKDLPVKRAPPPQFPDGY
mmetsp:Transcript_68754/g.147276  ORF Transcript_68754/g.147276 Transcript_68754/m.147276 type:complete len:219 (+) Transcript_68754:52-708(+)